MSRHSRLVLALVCLVSGACVPAQATPTASAPAGLEVTSAPVTASAASATGAPTQTVEPKSDPTDEPSPPPSPAPEWPRPHYALTATLHLAEYTLAVQATITVVPPSGDRLIFNLNALQSATLIGPLEVQVNGAVAAQQAEGVWVMVPLPPDLTAGDPARVAFEYRIALAQVNAGAWGWRGTLGWTGRQVNLGDWHPALAPYAADTGWLTPQPTPLGEYATTPMADFEVAIEVLGNTRPVLVAGSGHPQACEATACFEMAGGRYPAYVVSESMQAQSMPTTTGVTVTSVYMPEHVEAGEAALRTAAAAVETYAGLYGAYPFGSFVQVEGDFYDGMEYSGLSFVGAGYYGEYDGTPNNLLTIISAHEVAHQWWHTLVGNDQAGEPWLDEALCTYSELLFMERKHPEAVPWWWAFRIQWFAPSGAVDSTIYAHGDFRGYVDAVYLRGAQMLHAMRQAVGEARFAGFLRDYAAVQAGRIATGQDFWNAYAAAGGDAAAIQAQYFADP